MALAIGLGEPLLLLFPLPFFVGFGLPYLFRPLGFEVSSEGLAVLRPVGPVRIGIRSVRRIRVPATRPVGVSVGILRVDGIHGSFGRFWNKEWGSYRKYVTDHANTVELELSRGGHVIVSPAEPVRFALAIQGSAVEAGITVELQPQG